MKFFLVHLIALSEASSLDELVEGLGVVAERVVVELSHVTFPNVVGCVLERVEQ